MLSDLEIAKFDLYVLDMATADAHFEDPVAISIAKALTVAAEHPGVETQVHCVTKEEVLKALSIIYSRKVWARENAKWNSAEGGLELPNGSLVVVMFQGKRAVPK